MRRRRAVLAGLVLAAGALLAAACGVSPQDEAVRIADLSRLHVKYPFIAFMPQWDFLNFLRESGKRLASLKVMMSTEAIDLIHDGERIAGVKARTPDGFIDIEPRHLADCRDYPHQVPPRHG